ncbi:MAG: hypothetical protein JXA83_03050 [Acidimicrobiales bacterium]|nr:hypothetical protein [Acidimicrobiales bacterium]
MKRTITGRAAARAMTLGELRQFIASLDGIPDEATIRTRATFRRHLRSVTVEEEDVGFSDYVRAVGDPDRERPGGRKDGSASGKGGRVKSDEKASV